MNLDRAKRYVYAPRAGLIVYLYALLRGRRIVCYTASRLLGFTRRIEFFDARDVPKYYARHCRYEKQLIERCHPATLADCFAHQLYIEDALAYLVPLLILREFADVELVAPPKLKSALFPQGTRFIASPLDWLRRYRTARSFSRLFIAASGDSVEMSYVPFENATAWPVRGWWKGLFPARDLDFYRLMYACLTATLAAVPGLEKVKSLRTRRFRDSTEYSENIAFDYCQCTGKRAVSAQQRVKNDSSIEFSFSSYHEYEFWDAESQRIYLELCHGNRVDQPSIRKPPETNQRAVAHVVSNGRKVLAFPAQVEDPTVYSNSAYTDVHVAAEFLQFLRELEAQGFSITVKLKLPGEAAYYPGFTHSTLRDYEPLLAQFDCFLACGYTTPGIELRARGLNAVYYYPRTEGPRLYGDMTISSVPEFMAATARAAA